MQMATPPGINPPFCDRATKLDTSSRSLLEKYSARLRSRGARVALTRYSDFIVDVAPAVGFEPTTREFRSPRSTTELSRPSISPELERIYDIIEAAFTGGKAIRVAENEVLLESVFHRITFRFSESCASTKEAIISPSFRTVAHWLIAEAALSTFSLSVPG